MGLGEKGVAHGSPLAGAVVIPEELQAPPPRRCEGALWSRSIRDPSVYLRPVIHVFVAGMIGAAIAGAFSLSFGTTNSVVTAFAVVGVLYTIRWRRRFRGTLRAIYAEGVVLPGRVASVSASRQSVAHVIVFEAANAERYKVIVESLYMRGYVKDQACVVLFVPGTLEAAIVLDTRFVTGMVGVSVSRAVLVAAA